MLKHWPLVVMSVNNVTDEHTQLVDSINDLREHSEFPKLSIYTHSKLYKGLDSARNVLYKRRMRSDFSDNKV